MTKAFQTIYAAIQAENENTGDILLANWSCLHAFEKPLIAGLYKAAFGGGGGGGGVSNPDDLVMDHIVTAAGPDSIQTVGWTIDPAINSMQLTTAGVEMACIYIETSGEFTTSYSTYLTGQDSWGVQAVASGLNSVAVQGENGVIGEEQAAGVGVWGKTSVNEDGIGLLAETTQPDSWAFVIRNQNAARINFKSLATGDRQQNFLDVEGSIVVNSGNIPANSAAAGTAGEISTDGDYLYICFNTNAWRRVDLSIF